MGVARAPAACVGSAWQTWLLSAFQTYVMVRVWVLSHLIAELSHDFEPLLHRDHAVALAVLVEGAVEHPHGR